MSNHFQLGELEMFQPGFELMTLRLEASALPLRYHAPSYAHMDANHWENELLDDFTSLLSVYLNFHKISQDKI